MALPNSSGANLQFSEVTQYPDNNSVFDVAKYSADNMMGGKKYKRKRVGGNNNMKLVYDEFTPDSQVSNDSLFTGGKKYKKKMKGGNELIGSSLNSAYPDNASMMNTDMMETDKMSSVVNVSLDADSSVPMSTNHISMNDNSVPSNTNPDI